MQAALISPEEAVAQAKARLGETNPKNTVGNGRGTIVFSDAADATTSGASGNSNQLLRALVEGGYTGSVLFPIVDPDAVAEAKRIGGEGAQATISLGGLDPRYPPLELEVTVEAYKEGVPLMAKVTTSLSSHIASNIVLQNIGWQASKVPKGSDLR
jgi:microcystin degradation protein MlrC